MIKDLNYVGKIFDLLLSTNINDGKVILDLTAGNGNDILKADKLMADGIIYGFDIQEDAIKNTKKLLNDKSNNKNQINLFRDCHSNISKYIDTEVDLVMMNLGYLPGGNKNTTTTSKTTIESLKHALKLLKNDGKILVMVYTGHKEGVKELSELTNFFKVLDQRNWNVLNFRIINQINNPPELFVLEKRK